MMLVNPRNTALVISINNRFFSRLGKNKRVMTSWSLPGSRLFFDSFSLSQVTNVLHSKNKKFSVLAISISAMPKTTHSTACGA